MLREYGEIVYGSQFHLRLKGAVYKSHGRSSILHKCDAWCLKEGKIGIIPGSERSIV